MFHIAPTENVLPQIGLPMFHKMRDCAQRNGRSWTRIHVRSEHRANREAIRRQQIEKILLRVLTIVSPVGSMAGIRIVNIFTSDNLADVVQSSNVSCGNYAIA